MKNQNIQAKILKKRTMFSLQKKETSSQEIQISTESNAEISENMSTDNNNNRIMWMRMMSNDDMSATLLMTEHDQKSLMIEWENRMKIICTIIKQK